MKYIGIDPSLTHSAITLLNPDGTFNVFNIQPKTLRGVDRLIYIRNEFLNILKNINLDVKLIALESYTFNIRAGHSFSLGELGGMYKIVMTDNKLPFINVNPMTLKKYVTGSGRTEKNQMMLSIFKKWKAEFKNDDEADSYALARIAEFYDVNNPTTKIEKEILKSLKGQNKELLEK